MISINKTNTEKTGVLHLIDTLETGGAERVAVNLVNLLPRDRYTANLCTTRGEGPLSSLVRDDVQWLRLHRKRHFDLKALACLVNYIRQNHIKIIHAHSSSLFIAAEVKLFLPGVKIIWHVHSGSYQTGLPAAYRFAAPMVDGVIAVNESLALRAMDHLKVPKERVWYIRNFVVSAKNDENQTHCAEFPGKCGKRIVCVSNFRPEKDHLTLVKAFSGVVGKEPEARLFLVGLKIDLDYYQELIKLVSELNLSQQVVVLGQRNDVQQILGCFDIGVLSSRSEGLPLSLLEYGQAKLAVVVTDVGQCRKVIDDGRAGRIVSPQDTEGLSAALIELLENFQLQQQLGEAFYQRVAGHYSAKSAVEEIDKIYMKLLAK